MQSAPVNCVVLLGPTAVGKTEIAVGMALAAKGMGYTGGEVISADSRQVYRGLDLASGKDISEYSGKDEGGAEWSVPHHLIDICGINTEYSVFDYQRDFYRVFPQVLGRGALPVVAGGTGMYLDCILRGYGFVSVKENKAFRAQAVNMSLDELSKMLLSIKGDVHGGEDLRDKDRCIKAIEIALYMQSEEGKAAKKALTRPNIQPLVIGTTLQRDEVWSNILRRLKERIKCGMIEEIASIHHAGTPWSRLEGMGLECKYAAWYLQGKIKTQEELEGALFIAIRQFAKRQETWFRGMQKKGVTIHWLPPVRSVSERLESAVSLMQTLSGQSSRLCCPSR